MNLEIFSAIKSKLEPLYQKRKVIDWAVDINRNKVLIYTDDGTLNNNILENLQYSDIKIIVKKY